MYLITYYHYLHYFTRWMMMILNNPFPVCTKIIICQNGIASYLQHQTHAAGAHSDQTAKKRAHTNNKQDGVLTFGQFQPEWYLMLLDQVSQSYWKKLQSKSKQMLLRVSGPEEYCSSKHSWKICCIDLFQLIKKLPKWE